MLVGWIGGTPASQSLARDLSLSPTYELLQQFVPELQSLRLPGTHAFGHWKGQEGTHAITGSAGSGGSGGSTGANQYQYRVSGSMQLEVVAEFHIDPKHPPSTVFGVTVLGESSKEGSTAAATGTKLFIDCTASPCVGGVDATSQGGKKVSGPVTPIAGVFHIHAIVDHTIIGTNIVSYIWMNMLAHSVTIDCD